MKKIVIYSIIIVVLLGLSGCYQDDSLVNTTPQDVYYERVVASLGDVKTKVFFDDAGDFSWTAGDKISLYTSLGEIKEIEITESGESVTVDVPLAAGEYRDRYAVYPSSSCYRLNGDELIIKYPDTYEYNSAVAATPMVAVNTSSSNQLQFKHVGGLVKIDVSNIPEGTTELKLVFPGIVTGYYSVTMDSDGNPQITRASNVVAKNKRIITVTGITGSSATLYIPVPTGTLYGHIGIISNVTGTYIKEATVSINKEFNRKDGKKLTVSNFSNKKAYDFLKLAYGNANCFIVLPSETSKQITLSMFSVNTLYVRQGGALSDVTVMQKPASASIYWRETSLSFKVSLERSINNSSYFKLSLSNISGKGNAVVAIYGPDENILWSYHIWVPGFDPNENHVTVTKDGKTYQIMRAALGATAPGLSENDPSLLSYEHAGLFYQWGRKDPLGRPGTSSSFSSMYGTYPSLSQSGYVKSNVASQAIADSDVGSVTDPYVLENRKVIKYSVLHPSTIILRANDPQDYDWICGTTYLDIHDGKLWQTSNKTIFDPSPGDWQVPNTKELYGKRSLTFDNTNRIYKGDLYAYIISSDPFDLYCGFGHVGNTAGNGWRFSSSSYAYYWSTGDGDKYGKELWCMFDRGTTYTPPSGDVHKEDGLMIRCARLIDEEE